MDHVIHIRIRNNEFISDMSRGKEHHVIGPNFDGVAEVNDDGMLIRDDEVSDMRKGQQHQATMEYEYTMDHQVIMDNTNFTKEQLSYIIPRTP